MDSDRHASTATRGGRSVHTNLFDALRLVAAGMVVVGHAWPLSGSQSAPTLGGVTIHHLGVYIFFAISGYLMARSWARDGRPLWFLVRRSLRIFPALVLVVLLTTFVIGPLVTALSPRGYFGAAPTWQYLLNTVLVAQYELPGVFTSNPSVAVNGSLWSLGPEFVCYLLTVVFGLTLRRHVLIARLTVALALGVAATTLEMPSAMRITLTAGVFFFLGASFASIPAPLRLPIWPAVIAVPALAFVPAGPGTLLVWLVIPYAVIAIGERQSPIGRALSRIGDPSYGMYLWAFLLQQFLIDLYRPLPLWQSVLAVLLGCLTLGLVSWHLVERPAIRLGRTLSARAGPRPEERSSTGASTPAEQRSRLSPQDRAV